MRVTKYASKKKKHVTKTYVPKIRTLPKKSTLQKVIHERTAPSAHKSGHHACQTIYLASFGQRGAPARAFRVDLSQASSLVPRGEKRPNMFVEQRAMYGGAREGEKT